MLVRAVQNVWQEVLRCVSRWELLQQIASGGPSDALLFAAPAEPVTAVKRRNFFSRAPKDGGVLCTPVSLLCFNGCTYCPQCQGALRHNALIPAKSPDALILLGEGLCYTFLPPA